MAGRAARGETQLGLFGQTASRPQIPTSLNRRMVLVCPHCGEMNSHVIPRHQTVEQQLTGKFWRLRRCDHCRGTFTTTEGVEP